MLTKLFRPRPTISGLELAGGLRWLTLEGMASLGFSSITTSGFLAAFALALGANHFQIGVLAAIPFLTQPLQIAVIPLVERFRKRKIIALVTWIPSQLIWLPIALIPLLMDTPGAAAIAALLGLMTFRSILQAGTNCAWNSWIRDLVPQQVLGRFLSRRLALAGIVGMVFGLLAAFFVDYWKGHVSPESQNLGYAFPLLFGFFTLVLIDVVAMAMMPEPLMQAEPGPAPSLARTVTTPLRDKNYRRLLNFLLLWGFAINLATPFFAVYMLERLGLPLMLVIGLSVLGQAFNIVFVRIWGRFADQFSNKVVLSLSVSLYLLVIFGWIFTSAPVGYLATVSILVILHALAGIASAGVSLTTGTIGLKLAPQGKSTAYLAGAALALNLGFGLGPLLGGRLSDFFSARQLNITFTWVDPGRSFNLPALSLTGLDFLFVISFILGLVTLSLLAGVKEEGEAGRETVLESLFAPMRDFFRPMSSMPVLSFFSQFPYGYLKRSPFPGLDVALGVTVYQIAAIAKAATLAAERGRKATVRLTRALDESLSSLWKEAGGGQYGSEIAKQVARGSIHAIRRSANWDVGEFAYHTVLNVVEALRRQIDPSDILRAASYGVVQGAGEMQADVGQAACRAVEAARSMTPEPGLSTEDAVAQATQGALEAAEALGPQAVAQVKASLAGQASVAEIKEQLGKIETEMPRTGTP